MDAVHEVWARAAWATIDLAESAGLPTEHLFDGLPFDAKSVRRLKRVSWDDYCVLCERVGELAPGSLEDLLEGTYHETLPELRTLAGAIVDCKRMMWFVFEILDPLVFPALHFKYEDLGGRHIRLTVRLRAGARPCEAWFRGSIGALRGMPRHFDLPPATVSADIGADHGIYDVTLPESRTLTKRARGALKKIGLRFVLGTEPDGTPIAGTFGNVSDDSIHDSLEARIDVATAAWKLTPRQAEVLRFVADGRSNKDVAQALGCAENTVELHVTQLLRRAGATSRTQLVAHFWGRLRV